MKHQRLFGEDGGGLILSQHWIDENYLTSTEPVSGWREGEDGYLESCQLPKILYWITLLHIYESYQLSPQDIEIRPAWFHLANHAFFNAPV